MNTLPIRAGKVGDWVQVAGTSYADTPVIDTLIERSVKSRPGETWGQHRDRIILAHFGIDVDARATTAAPVHEQHPKGVRARNALIRGEGGIGTGSVEQV